jgi:hypothetical protein
MFGLEIPAWAVGVGVIIIAASLGGALKRLLTGDREPFLPRRGSRREMARTVADLEGRLREVDELRSRLGDAQDVERRLSELEERVDFAERLLTKQRDLERLGPQQP